MPNTHSTPLGALVLAEPGEVMSAMNFARTLYLHGDGREWSIYSPFGKLWQLFLDGEEHRLLAAVDAAKAEVAGHPFEPELVAIIDAAVKHVGDVLASWKGSRFEGMYNRRPFAMAPGSPVIHRPGPKRSAATVS